MVIRIILIFLISLNVSANIDPIKERIKLGGKAFIFSASGETPLFPDLNFIKTNKEGQKYELIGLLTSMINGSPNLDSKIKFLCSNLPIQYLQKYNNKPYEVLAFSRMPKILSEMGFESNTIGWCAAANSYSSKMKFGEYNMSIQKSKDAYLLYLKNNMIFLYFFK